MFPCFATDVAAARWLRQVRPAVLHAKLDAAQWVPRRRPGLADFDLFLGQGGHDGLRGQAALDLLQIERLDSDDLPAGSRLGSGRDPILGYSGHGAIVIVDGLLRAKLAFLGLASTGVLLDGDLGAFALVLVDDDPPSGPARLLALLACRRLVARPSRRECDPVPTWASVLGMGRT